ncbi:MAG: regulatory protein RecX [Pseudobdellovibrio sp.]
MSFHKPENKTPTLNEAKKKLMDFVARREYSEKELREKLSVLISPEMLDQVIRWGYEKKWLSSPRELQTDWSERLSKRGQGVKKINQKLESLGLETLKSDFEQELQKARKFVSTKWSSVDFQNIDLTESRKLRAKVVRFLSSRGYEAEVINYILKNDLKSTANSEDEIYDEEF